MGKQVSTLKAVGKVGDIVGFTTKKGEIGMRAKSIKPYTSQTKKQIIQRTRFLAVTSLAQRFLPAIAGLTPTAVQQRITKRNAFVKLNMPAVTVLDPASESDIHATTNYADVILSRGMLGGVTFSGARFDDTLTVKVNFAANLEGYMANADDEVILAVYAPEVDEIVLADRVTRNEGTVEIQVPTGWNGLTVHVFGYTMGFKDSADRVTYDSYWDGSYSAGEARAEIERIESEAIYSNSVYVGNGTIS